MYVIKGMKALNAVRDDILFTSDQLFYDEDILYERQSWTVEQMNDYLIQKWNSVVKRNDIVFHLGNFSVGSIPLTKSILQKLSYRSSSFFFQTNILIRTVKKGYLFAEVPSKLGLRESGVSKAVSFFSLSQIIKGYFILLKYIYLNNNLKVDDHFSCDSVSAARWEENAYKK